MDYVTLNNGLKMPMVGFGVFRVPDKKECEESVYQAIKAGYRLIDTAAAYYNEDAVGAAVKRAIADGLCTREDLFITSKLWVQDMMDYESAQKGIEASLEKSGLEYFDLLEEFKVNKTQVPFEKFLEELVNREYDRMIEVIDKYKK